MRQCLYQSACEILDCSLGFQCLGLFSIFKSWRQIYMQFQRKHQDSTSVRSRVYRQIQEGNNVYLAISSNATSARRSRRNFRDERNSKRRCKSCLSISKWVFASRIQWILIHLAFGSRFEPTRSHGSWFYALSFRSGLRTKSLLRFSRWASLQRTKLKLSSTNSKVYKGTMLYVLYPFLISRRKANPREE